MGYDSTGQYDADNQYDAVGVTRWFAVNKALYTLLNTNPTLTGKIINGPDLTGQPLTGHVLIGYELTNNERVGTLEQDWRTLGRDSSTRTETGTIRCQVVTQTGDQNHVTATQARAAQLLAAVEDTLRDNLNLGVAEVDQVELRASEIHQRQTKTGMSVLIDFEIRYTAYLSRPH